MNVRKERFIKSFNFCMKKYGCTKQEAAYEKKRALKNLKEAERCFNSIHDAWMYLRVTRRPLEGDKKEN